MKAMMVARPGLNPSYACETAWLSIENCVFRVPYAHRRLRTPGKQTRKCWRLGLALCRRDFATRSLVCACTNRLRRPFSGAPALAATCACRESSVEWAGGLSHHPSSTCAVSVAPGSCPTFPARFCRRSRGARAGTPSIRRGSWKRAALTSCP